MVVHVLPNRAAVDAAASVAGQVHEHRQGSLVLPVVVAVGSIGGDALSCECTLVPRPGKVVIPAVTTQSSLCYHSFRPM